MSFSLILVSPAYAQDPCDTYYNAMTRIGAELDITTSKRVSLKIGSAEWCTSSKHEDALFDRWNKAYKAWLSCSCRGDCEGAMDEYTSNLEMARQNRDTTTNEACN